MSEEYENLSREALIGILKSRDAQTSYGLTWEKNDIDPDSAVNKDFVGLTLDPTLSCGEGPWHNLIIEGDNYDALRNLVSTHAGQANLIYIDPPYNTGRRDFVYNDHYFDSTDRFRHSTWLEFMYQRLRLAKDLLKPDGAIFVSIDDNEIFALGMLMNKVFGEKSFIANCIWQKRYSRDNTSAIGDSHEYVLVYSPNPDGFKKRRRKLPLDEKSRKAYSNKDTRGAWRAIPMNGAGFRGNMMYPITLPSGRVVYPPEGRHWSCLEPVYLNLKATGRIYFGKEGDSQPNIIRYLDEVDGLVPWTWWPHEEVGHTDEARKEIQDIFGSQTAFDTPKPVRLIERVLQIASHKNDLIVDFFAGSGTTAHAVLKMNAADQGTRRFILVSSSEAVKATDGQPDKNVCRDVCAERVRKVIAGYTSGKTGEVEAIPGSFAYLKTEHVPVHRLEEKLTDAMAWSFIQMRHDHPLTVATPVLSVSVLEDSALAYVANTGTAGLDALRVALATHPALLVYTWTPSAVLPLVAENNIRAIPTDLVRAFRFGHLPAKDPK